MDAKEIDKQMLIPGLMSHSLSLSCGDNTADFLEVRNVPAAKAKKGQKRKQNEKKIANKEGLKNGSEEQAGTVILDSR
jgi:hypothetical protein